MKQIKLTSTVCACLFILFPIVEMFLNLSGMRGADSYRIWLMMLYIPAAIGILLGYFHTRKINIYKLPIILMFAFGIWCLICTTKSETMTLSLFGFVPSSDSISVYLSYFGMIMLGLILGEEKKYALIVGKVFIAVTFILSVLSLIDSRALDPLFINESTNCFHYQSVYFNTNQFGYHLSIAIIINIYLFEYAEKSIEKVLYLISFIVLTNMLILNNTMGAYIAILLVLFFAVIWSFINRENKKMPALALLLFIVISAISCIYTRNILTSFSALFSDIGTVTDANADQEALEAVGSSRGELWQLAIIFIKISPIIGFGAQGVSFSAHNMFLQIAMYTGIPGLLLYLAIIVSGAVRLIQMRKTITPITKACAFAVVSYLISGFFGVTAFYTAPYFYLVLGVCLAGCQPKKEIEE